MTQERRLECNNQLASGMVSLFITGEEHSLLALRPCSMQDTPSGLQGRRGRHDAVERGSDGGRHGWHR